MSPIAPTRTRKETQMNSGHTESCSHASITKPKECKCICGGTLHGGPNSERARALVWKQDKNRKYSLTSLDYSKRHKKATRKKAEDAVKDKTKQQFGVECTDFAVTYAIDELISKEPKADQNAIKDVVGEIIETFFEDCIVKEVKNSRKKLTKNEIDTLERIIREEHILCVICAKFLERLSEISNAASEMVAKIYDEIYNAVIALLGFSRNEITDIIKRIIRAAIKKTYQKIFDYLIATVTFGSPINKKAIQILGFMSCPDVSQHHDVEEHCVKPLVNYIVPDDLNEWISKGFPKATVP